MSDARSERELPEAFDPPSTYQRVALALLECDEDGPDAFVRALAEQELEPHALTTIVTLLLPFLARAHDVSATEALEGLWRAVPDDD